MSTSTGTGSGGTRAGSAGATRVAMVGAGGVARRHAEVLTGLGARVEAVVDLDPAAAGALAGDVGAAVFTEVGEALDAVDVDAVYVCVPPFAHGPAEREVLARRLPLFVEKPVALDGATALELAAAAAEAGVVTGTGYHWRCLSTVEEAARLLADAPPALATASWLGKRPPVPWWAQTARSGGQVVEQATHVLDLARLLLGEPVAVWAAGVRLGLGGDVDDATAGAVRFDSGAVAALTTTSLLRSAGRAGLEVVAPGLRLEITEDRLLVDDGDGVREVRPDRDPRVGVDAEFLEAVRGEREAVRVPFAEAVRSHLLACAVAESAATGRALDLDADLVPVRA